MSESLLTPRQAAELLAIQPGTLASWRSSGKYSLPHVQLGRTIRYRRSDLDQFVQQRVVGAGGEE